MAGQLGLTRPPRPLLANLDFLATLPWDSLLAQFIVRKLTKPHYMCLDWESFLPLDRLDLEGLELLRRSEVDACIPGTLAPLASEITIMARQSGFIHPFCQLADSRGQGWPVGPKAGRAG